MKTPWEVQTVEALVQFLATNLIRHGYYHHFVGRVPEQKEPATVDAKLLERYSANLDKFSRARRKKKGLANVAYVRLGRDFILLATDGRHPIFDEHPMHDLRRRPIRLHGYSIGAGKGQDGKYHSSVRISDDAFDALVSHFVERSVHQRVDSLAHELSRLPYLPFARVRRQLLKLVRLVNERRRAAGFEPVPLSALTLRRQIVPVFGKDARDGSETEAAAA